MTLSNISSFYPAAITTAGLAGCLMAEVVLFGLLNKLDEGKDPSSLGKLELIAYRVSQSSLGKFGGKCLDIVSDKIGLTGAISNFKGNLAATIPSPDKSLKYIFAYQLVKRGLKKEHTVYDEKGAKYFTIFCEKSKGSSTDVGVEFHQSMLQKPPKAK